jgi:hypothetical protein
LRIITGGSGRVDDHHRLTALCSADHLQRRRGCFGELVDVGAGARPCRLRRNRRHDLGIRHDPRLCDRGDDRHGGLPATRHHVQIGGVEVLIEIDHWNAERPDGRGGEVEHPHTRFSQLGPVGAVCTGRGGVENEFDVAEVRHGQESVDTLGGSRHTHPGGPGQSVRCRVDADHHADGQRAVAAQDLDHQVGADIA